jgi:hypothetical protein
MEASMVIRLAALVTALVTFASFASALAAPISETPCGPGDAVFTDYPTKLVEVSGIVPLGNLNPKGHTVPSRHAYIYPVMTIPGDPSTAKTVPVFAPGKAEIVAVEYHPGAPDWSLHLKPCKEISLYYFHVDKLSPPIAAAVGDIADGGVVFPGSMTAKPVAIPVTGGQLLGFAQTFDVGLQDFRKPTQPFVNQARYKVDVPTLLAALGLAGNPIAIAVTPRIMPQALYNRCFIDYYKPAPRAALTARLSDYDGAPLASGVPPCHSHMQDVPNTARGNWWNDLDPVHDALFAEDHAIALVNWNVTPTVELFSLNENVPGFSVALFDAGTPPDVVNATFEFPVRPGPQRTNRRFAEITDDALYCYDLVRAHRGGPSLRAAILLQVSDGPGGPRSKLKIEFVPTSRCPALPMPWKFSGKEATYYR